MISAPTGETQNVTGRIIAIVVSGPMPGSTPIAVPIRQPKKHKPRFCQVSATPNPKMMLEKTSPMSKRRGPQRNGNFQRNDKDTDIGDDEDQAEQQQRGRAQVAAGEAGQHDAERERQHEPERPQQQRKGKTRGGNEDERAPCAAL